MAEQRITAKQRAWLSRYLSNRFDATEAARHVGYKDPGQSGWENKKKLEQEIETHLANLAMGADEALARLSDIAKGDMSEFITLRKEKYREPLPVTREAGIRRVGMKIENAKWALGNTPLTPEETDILEGQVGLWEQRVTKWQEEGAPDVVYLEGEGVEKERSWVELDVEKAKAADKLHLVKKYRMGKDGLSFELYDAQGALVDLLKIHGRYVDRKDLTSGDQPLKLYAGIDLDDV